MKPFYYTSLKQNPHFEACSQQMRILPYESLPVDRLGSWKQRKAFVTGPFFQIEFSLEILGWQHRFRRKETLKNSFPTSQGTGVCWAVFLSVW